MDDMNPSEERCLTPEERRELEGSWRAFQMELQPFGEMVEHAAEVDCDELHDAFLRLADVFDEVERVVMRAQQIRLLRGTQARQASE